VGTFVELNHMLRGGDDRVAAPIGRLLDRLVSGASRLPDERATREAMLSAMGTCLHAPAYELRGGVDLASIPLELVANVPGIVIPVKASIRREILPDALDAPIRLGGRAVLLWTGWDTRWGTGSYRDPGPYLSEQAAEMLVGAGSKLVGVDFPNVDDVMGLAGPVHARLLGVGIPIVEHLTNLGALPTSGFRFFAVPLRITRGASVPVRAFAEVGD
jgi:arylformamidase